MSKEKPSPKGKTTQEKSEQPAGEKAREIGGFENKAEPTRYGDWDVNGRCSDF